MQCRPDESIMQTPINEHRNIFSPPRSSVRNHIPFCDLGSHKNFNKNTHIMRQIGYSPMRSPLSMVQGNHIIVQDSSIQGVGGSAADLRACKPLFAM